MARNMRMAAFACAGLALAITAAKAQNLTPVEEGRRLYLANNCYGCHGDVGGGSAYGAPAFRHEGAELGDLSEAIREGEDRGMPSFPALNNATDINNIYAYLRSLGSPSEPVFYLWWEPVPIASILPRSPYLYAAARKVALRTEPMK